MVDLLQFLDHHAVGLWFLVAWLSFCYMVRR
jgi:hypothetical protein